MLVLSTNGQHLLALGLFVTGCSPGGGASNYWTIFLGGNANLSITMTFISTIGALGLCKCAGNIDKFLLFSDDALLDRFVWHQPCASYQSGNQTADPIQKNANFFVYHDLPIVRWIAHCQVQAKLGS
jgi:hypothetical protein